MDPDGNTTACAIPKCAMCWAPMVHTLVALPCGHVFHSACARDLLLARPDCPMCRRVAAPYSVLRLYLGYDDVTSAVAADEELAARLDSLAVDSPRYRSGTMVSDIRRIETAKWLAVQKSVRLERKVVQLRHELETLRGELRQAAETFDRRTAAALEEVAAWKRKCTYFPGLAACMVSTVTDCLADASTSKSRPASSDSAPSREPTRSCWPPPTRSLRTWMQPRNASQSRRRSRTRSTPSSPRMMEHPAAAFRSESTSTAPVYARH